MTDIKVNPENGLFQPFFGVSFSIKAARSDLLLFHTLQYYTTKNLFIALMYHEEVLNNALVDSKKGNKFAPNRVKMPFVWA